MSEVVRTVYAGRDDEGPIEVIDEGDGRVRTLHFGSTARQSTMFTARPQALALEYTRCMVAALLFLNGEPQRALILGLGGGSLPKFLHHHYPDCRIDVVELRPAIIDVAQRFFALPTDEPSLFIHQTDGYHFLVEAATTMATYDLLFIDLHDADGMAPVVDSDDFAPACRRVLAAGGVAVFNLWFGDRPEQERRLRAQLAQAFEPLLSAPVAGKRNHVAYGLCAPLASSASLAQRARQLGRRLNLPLSTRLQELFLRHRTQFEITTPHI